MSRFYEIAELSISSVEARGGGQHYEPFFWISTGIVIWSLLGIFAFIMPMHLFKFRWNQFLTV
jgi:hypothetical protein